MYALNNRKKMRKPSRVRKIIDDSQSRLNERYDNVRKILDTLEKYGVKDEDFASYPLYDCNKSDNIAGDIDRAEQKWFDEALDLCNVLNSLEQPRKWPFRKRPKDQTVQSIVNQLMKCYCGIVG